MNGGVNVEEEEVLLNQLSLRDSMQQGALQISVRVSFVHLTALI